MSKSFKLISFTNPAPSPLLEPNYTPLIEASIVAF